MKNSFCDCFYPLFGGLFAKKSPRNTLVVGGSGYGCELVHTRVTADEYERLFVLCQQHRRPIGVIETDGENLFICCSKEAYCYLFKLPA